MPIGRHAIPLVMTTAALLAGCTGGDGEGAEATTSSVAPVASGTGALGARAEGCDDDERFADDAEFAVALCEVDLALAEATDPPADGRRRRDDAVAGYLEDREQALRTLFDLADELAPAEG